MFVRAHRRATICRFKPHRASPSAGPGGKRPRPTLVLWSFIMYHMCVYHDDVSLDLFINVCYFLFSLESSINRGLSHILSFASCTCFYFGNPSFPLFVHLKVIQMAGFVLKQHSWKSSVCSGEFMCCSKRRRGR